MEKSSLNIIFIEFFVFFNKISLFSFLVKKYILTIPEYFSYNAFTKEVAKTTSPNELNLISNKFNFLL